MKRLWLHYLTVAVIAACIAFLVARMIAKREVKRLREDVQAIAALEDDLAGYGRNGLRLACIDAYVRSARKEGSLEHVQAAFKRCAQELEQSAPFMRDVPESYRFATFMDVFVSRLAPYGESTASTDREILQSPTLHCGVQSQLLARTLKRHYPEVQVRIVNLYNPLLTSHGVVYVSAPDAPKGMLLDPTGSVVAFVSLDEVLAGTPVPVRDTVDFYIGEEENIDRFRRYYRSALLNGGIRKQDITRQTVLE